MSLKEKQSERKCKALKFLVQENVYSPAYALEKLEELFDNNKVLEADYDILATWLEEQLVETIEEPIEEIEEGE